MVTWDSGRPVGHRGAPTAALLENCWSKRVNINYKPGGAGAIGWAEMVRSRPDGYLIAGSTSQHIFHPAHCSRMWASRPSRSYPSNLSLTPNLWAGRRDAPYTTMKELVTYAKAKPRQGEDGVDWNEQPGAHTLPCWLGKAAGISLSTYRSQHCAHDDGAPGRPHRPSPSRSPRTPFRLAIGYTCWAWGPQKRSEFLPNVPTLREQGWT